MRTLYKACLMGSTILTISAFSAHAEDIHANHDGHTLSVGTTDHSQHKGHAGHIHPEALAPISVMGDHTHDKGEWMVSYRYSRMHMDGNRQGTNDISPEEIVSTVSNPNAPPANLRVVPTQMDMDMHMFGAMYGVTDKLTLMGMAMYMKNDMDHVTFQGGAGTTRLGTFNTESSGWGDTHISGLYELYQDDKHTINARLGISAPTGSIKEEDSVLTPMNTTPTLRLPYAMQLGSGTWDGLAGFTYTGHQNQWSWGAQYNTTIRLESENSQGYRLGNMHDVTAWGGYKITPSFGVVTHISAETKGDIKGRDDQIAAPVQTANPDNYGGDIIELGAGFSYAPQHPQYNGMELGMDITAPVYQDLNGVQLERDWNISIGLSYSF